MVLSDEHLRTKLGEQLRKQCGQQLKLLGKQFAENFTEPNVVKVVIGPEKAVYHLNKGVLAAHSKYFAGLVSFSGQEAETTSVTLDDEVDSDVAFRAFIEFIHSGSYVHDDTLSHGGQLVFHTKLYIMGLRLCADVFGSAVTFAFMRTLESFQSEVDKLKSSNDEDTEAFDGLKVNSTVEDFVEVVGLIYDHTPTRMEKLSLSDQVGRMDSLRARIVLFTVDYFDFLTASPEFTAVMREYGDFAAEVSGKMNSRYKSRKIIDTFKTDF